MKLSRVFLALLLLITTAISPLYAGQITVSAASSLTEALADVVSHYQKQNPDEQVMLSFAGSQSLATQIELGAPVDLFISANLDVMQRLQQQQLVSASQPLLANRIVLAVRNDLQPPVNQLADLTRDKLLLTLGNPQVPIGRYTRQLFKRLTTAPNYGPKMVQQIKQNVVSEESQVKAIVAKLLLGETDAGFVYQSDLMIDHCGILQAITLPPQYCPQAIYPMAKVQGHNQSTDRFYTFLQSEPAQQIFHDHGFLTLEKP